MKRSSRTVTSFGGEEMKTFVKVFYVPLESEPIMHAAYWKAENEINDFACKNNLSIVSISEHQKRVVWVVFKEKKSISDE